MEIFTIIGIITAFFKYRNAKADGTLPAKPEIKPDEPYVPKPLRDGASRMERLAHWLGIE